LNNFEQGLLDTFTTQQATCLAVSSPRPIKYHTPLSAADVLVVCFCSSPRKHEND